MSTETPTTPQPLNEAGRRKLRRTGLIAVAIAAGVVVIGLVERHHAAEETAHWTADQAIPTVRLITPGGSTDGQVLTLPATLEPLFNAPIYARVNGYLKRWYHDIGSHVTKGEVLADIDAPDLDQQLAQARADLASARSNLALARVTANRWGNLLKTDSVSKQEYDEKNGDLQAKQAALDAAKANVDRLQALTSFKQITAPFDGVITARRTDIGALINAGSSNDGPALFSVADVSKLRVLVPVPQAYSDFVQPGLTATVTIPEMPGRTFNAVMTGASNAINVASGTQLVQLEIDNKDGALVPGTYSEVSIRHAPDSDVLRVPSTALLFRHEGLSVAVVDAARKVHIHPIQVAQDNGSSVLVASGITAADQLVDNPPDSLADGDLVRIQTPAAGGQP